MEGRLQEELRIDAHLKRIRYLGTGIYAIQIRDCIAIIACVNSSCSVIRKMKLLACSNIRPESMLLAFRIPIEPSAKIH